VPRTPALPPNAALRWSVVRRLVDGLAPESILEIGCGKGAFGARLASTARYLGIEPDPTSFAVARDRIEVLGGVVRNHTSDDLEAASVFDLVCAFEVLEHLEDDGSALAAWHDLVAPSGHILLSMPAWQERFNEWDALVGHYRRYSPEQAERALLAAGFVDVRSVVYGWPLGYALEAVRGRIAAGRGVADENGAAPSMQERTAGSGRILQPRAMVGRAAQVGVAPFVGLQRLRPTRGTGIVVLARRPAAAS
jgi:SAM-dependent methyltransferase